VNNIEVEQELARTRDRLHKMADMIQAQNGQLVEHNVMIRSVTEDVARLQDTTATSDQLEAMGNNMAHIGRTLELKLGHLADTMEPIRRGVYWMVGIILASVLGAVLFLVIRNGPLP
jgi:hypothetical protein